MKRVILTTATALAFTACDGAENPADPAMQVAALETDLFTLRGNVRFNTCDTPRPVSNVADFRARGRASPTCDALTGQDQLDCIALVQPNATTSLITSPAFLPGTAAPGDEGYAMQPQRVFTDSNGTQWPISYVLTDVSNSNRGPRFDMQNGSRLVFHPAIVHSVTAAGTTGGVVVQDYGSDQMASMRINVVYTPSLRLADTTLDPADRITALSVNVLAYGSGSSNITRYTHRFQGGFAADTVAPNDPDYPATTDKALNTPAIDGTTVTPQRVRTETPLMPQVGADADLTYVLRIIANFGDGVRVSQDFPFQPDEGTTVGACDRRTQTVALVRPDTHLDGSIFMRPAADYPGGQSPFATHYSPTVREVADGTGPQPTTTTSDNIYRTTSTPNAAFDFSFFGIPESSGYRVDQVVASSGGRSIMRGHVLLSYPGRPPFTYASSSYPAMFRFPMNGASDPDGTFPIVAGTPVALRIGSSDDVAAPSSEGDMAFIEGTLDLEGCVDDMAIVESGTAEVLGGAGRGTTELAGGIFTTRGMARGLFDDGTNGYEIAAIGGSWVENMYRLHLKDTSYDGYLIIEPATKQTFNLTPGWAQRVTAAPRQYATSRVSVAFALTGGTPFRNARLEIHNDGSQQLLGNFYDIGTGTNLGRYYAQSNALTTAVRTSDSLQIVGLSSTGQVSVRASAEVETPAGSGIWTRTSFLSKDTAMDGCGICMTLDGTTYQDDGAGPVVSNLTPSATVPTSTTTYTLSGTLTDQVPITKVVINGTEYPVTSTSDGAATPTFTATFSVSVALPVEGANPFEISAAGLCGNVTPDQQVVITRVADLCDAPVFDQCTEPALGSVFHVAVVDAQGHPCRLPCTIAAPGQAPACDTNAIVCEE